MSAIVRDSIAKARAALIPRPGEESSPADPASLTAAMCEILDALEYLNAETEVMEP